jgi:hypothetical protein
MVGMSCQAGLFVIIKLTTHIYHKKYMADLPLLKYM